MACPRERLACLTLVLSLLCPGAHRVSKKDSSSGGFLSVVGDERPAQVPNICKDNGRVKCTRENKASCYWDWDEDAVKFKCRPRTCTGLMGSDCRELKNQCTYEWNDNTGRGTCFNKAVGATAAFGFANPCKYLELDACRLETEHCNWFEEKCWPKTCVGIMGTDCQELKTMCIWKVNNNGEQKECEDLPKDNPCKNLRSGGDCRFKPALCKWDWNYVTSTGTCRPKTCAGIKDSDCKELKGHCKWDWGHETHSGKCVNTQAAGDRRNPCKFLSGANCRSNYDTCTWDWNETAKKGNCRPKSCAGIKGIDCINLPDQCRWSWNKVIETGKCLEVQGPLTDNPCRNLTAYDCRFVQGHECVWDLNSTTFRNYCRPKTCARIKGTHCRELTSQCTWVWDKVEGSGQCLDIPKVTTLTTTTVGLYRDNPCKGLFANHCRLENEDCDWDFNKETHSGVCRPKTCASIKGSHCKELSSQCKWQWNATLNTGECLNLVGEAKGKFRDNLCKNLKDSECKKMGWTCAWDWNPQTNTGNCRPWVCNGLKGSDCKELSSHCIWKWDKETQTGECLTLPKATTSTTTVAKPKLKDNPCKNLKGSDCKDPAKNQYCTWDWNKQTSTGNCRPKTCAGIKGNDCRELSSQCSWKWDQNTQTGQCLDLPKAQLRDDPCKDLKGSDCRNKSEDCVWDWNKQTSTGICRPKTCAGIRAVDCMYQTQVCRWKWDADTQTGECVDRPQAPTTTSTTTVAKPKLKDNPCKNLRGSQCKDPTKNQYCTWDWNTQTLTGNCRPKTCAGIKGSDCRELSSQCTWNWNKLSQMGECLDLPKADLKDNPCKNLIAQLCMAKKEYCVFDWNKETFTGNCRPKTCAGIKGNDCRELTSQCSWKWDQNTQTGQCLDLPKATTTRTTTTVAKYRDNPCRNLFGDGCTRQSEHCDWDFNTRTHIGNCRPKTCAGIKGSDCKELWSQCEWEWDTTSKTGECLDLAPKMKALATSTSTTTAVKAKLKDNPCKDLKGSLCRDKSEHCAWDWNKQTSTGNCRPHTCAGIKGTDCRELTEQCVWYFDTVSRTGSCLDLPEVSTTTPAPKPKLKDNPCKDLKGSLCRDKSEECAWDWDKLTSTGNCRPRSCAGIKGTDCRDLTSQCAWRWNPISQSGECLDIPKAPAATTTTAERGMANQCKNLRQFACLAKPDVCVYNPLAKSCKPRTCVGLRGSDCRGLPYYCVWQWEEDFRAGRCLDIIPPTTATTTSASSRTAWFVSSLLVSLLGAMGPLWL